MLGVAARTCDAGGAGRHPTVPATAHCLGGTARPHTGSGSPLPTPSPFRHGSVTSTGVRQETEVLTGALWGVGVPGLGRGVGEGGSADTSARVWAGIG
jgi:hypothetical protein